MATPNFEKIKSFSTVTNQLIQRATDDFMALYSQDMTLDEAVELVSRIAEQYGIFGKFKRNVAFKRER